MKRIFLGLAIHNHQPVGNFPWVFEEAYKKAYLPMLEALEKHPGIRLSCHYSGPLLDWLVEHQPGFVGRVAELVKRGQAEVMTGGYYEPILPIIPDEDKLGQVRKMTEALEKLFGQRAMGLWLAERVWEPHLPKALACAGVSWTIVDDAHFKMVGLSDKDLFGYYITEEQGDVVKVFATSKHLRYSIPWRDVSEVIEYLRHEAEEDGSKIAVFGDDGEKFGIWPGTYEHCWQKGWVEKFFTALEENSSWLTTIPLGEYVGSFSALGRVYLPAASYAEMMEWALPANKSLELASLKHKLDIEGMQDVAQYTWGGFWRSFLAKYPEANILHKKMLRVHHKVYKARSLGNEECGLDDLWMGQCNCPYWHGVFGGLYLTDVRTAAYKHLIRAENRADALLHKGRRWLELEVADVDCDGQDEILVEGDALSLHIDPADGGAIFQWDLRKREYNLQSTLTRRPEPYHSAIAGPGEKKSEGLVSIHEAVRVKEPSIHHRLHYDRYPRFSMLEHFLPLTTSLNDLSSSLYTDLGDFAGQPYGHTVRKEADIMGVTLRREGRIASRGQTASLVVEKELLLKRGHENFDVSYKLVNLSRQPIEFLFGSEWNINLLGGGNNPQAYLNVPGETQESRLSSPREILNSQELTIGNRGLDIALRLRFSPNLRVWAFPVESISNSEGGVEAVYQGTCLFLHIPVKLDAGKSLSLVLTWISEE